MPLSINNGSSTGKNRFQSAGVRSLRLIMYAALVAAIMLGAMIAPPRHTAQQPQACQPDCSRDIRKGCFGSERIDLVFLVDRSGSLATRGQTYNAQIEGIERALFDPMIVPRDGSVAVGIITFNRAAEIRIPLTEINSATTAATVAAAVAALRCDAIGSSVPPCPADDTDYDAAIRAADIHLRQQRPFGHPRFAARRIMLMTSDGTPNLPDFGTRESKLARDAAAVEGIRLELDAIFVGNSTSSPEFEVNRATLTQIVFRVPASDGMGTVLTVGAGDCNIPGATFGADCERQVADFAAHTRTILRSDIAPLSLVVATDADVAPESPVTGALSLRQAIELANCNGGRTTITFAEGVRGSIIRPLTPLPALLQPEITIDGCEGTDCAPSITIDGADTEVMPNQGHCDGILIRSHSNVVRGLRISNFKRAGIAITPCSFDSFGHNRIELNVLEANAEAGVLVSDPPPEQLAISAAQQTLVIHNEGNVISRNTISGSATLIDLATNIVTVGPTSNDAGDADEGPNTLLNFPDQMNVVADGNTVTVTGQLNGPTVAGATVEIFAVTDFSVTADRVIVEGVSFLGQTTADADGAFNAAGVTPSLSGIYTATVTDLEGNTSELMADGDPTNPDDPELPHPRLAAVVPANFGNVDLNSQPQTRQFVITNTGNAPLTINCGALAAICNPEMPGTPDPRFSVSGCPTAPINPTAGPDDQVNRAIITVTFRANPPGFTGNLCGPTEVCLTLDANDPFQLQLASRITATVVGTTQPLVSASTLTFKRIAARGAPRTSRIPSQSFTVENNGCDNLVVTFGSILRTGNDVTDNRRDDTRFFSVRVSNPGGADTAFGPGSQVTIGRGTNNGRTFTVLFNPVIPAVTNCKSEGPLAAADVLPDEVNSVLTLNHNGGGSPITVNLVGRVKKRVRYIDPSDPSRDPAVTFTRSGDEFSVQFSVYDSDLSVNTATFEFLRSDGSVVGQAQIINLRDVLPGCLARGQSFTVTQKFTGASDNRNVVRVRVTVSDGGSSDTLTSNTIGTTSRARLKRQ